MVAAMPPKPNMPTRKKPEKMLNRETCGLSPETRISLTGAAGAATLSGPGEILSAGHGRGDCLRFADHAQPARQFAHETINGLAQVCLVWLGAGHDGPRVDQEPLSWFQQVRKPLEITSPFDFAHDCSNPGYETIQPRRSLCNLTPFNFVHASVTPR